MKPSMVLVVGYGNTLRQDDGFGPVVAERLRKRVTDSRVRILTRQLLSIELVADLAQFELCVLVDAATSGVRGEVVMHEVLPESTEVGSLGHDLSAAALLDLTQQLMGRAPKCTLCSTLPESMELGEELTASVSAVVDVAVDAIARLIDDYFAGVAAGAAG